MEPYELLRYVVTVLEQLELPYLITGSMASIRFGEPRLTNDIDIVVRLPLDKIGALCGAFPADEFYVSEDAARSAVLHHGQFNVIHPTSGLKVDLITPHDTAFDRQQFVRASREQLEEHWHVTFASPEDVIIKKMEFYKEGESEKHLRDIAGMLKISSERIDCDYIAEWADRLGLNAIWQAILERTGNRAE